MVYKWAPGSQVKGAKPQVVGTHLERLRQANSGNVTPEIIVRDAKSKSSPLHGAFEWNVRTAAEKYWLQQAGYILRSVVVLTSREGEEEQYSRAFVSIVEDDEQVFTSIVRAMGNADLRSQVVATALAEFEALRNKYSRLVELAKVYEQLDAAKARTAKRKKPKARAAAISA